MTEATDLSRFTQEDISRIIDSHELFVGGRRGGRRAILHYGKARGIDFSRRRLMGADFTGTDLQGANLVEADLDRATLNFADMRGVNATAARFVAAEMRGVSLRNAVLTGVNLDDADLSEAVLSLRGVGASFSQPRLGSAAAPAGIPMSVDFTGATLKQARLVGANLQRANFSETLLNGADLRGAELTGARMDGAVLSGAILDGVRIDPLALARCVLDPTPGAVDRVATLLARLEAGELWVRTNGAQGQIAVLDREDLRPLGAALANRCLTALSARNVCAVAVSFVGAQLQGARFDGADLRDADFTDADLRGASFRGAKLRHACFTRADVRPLALINGGASAIDLQGADLAENCFAQSRQA